MPSQITYDNNNTNNANLAIDMGTNSIISIPESTMTIAEQTTPRPPTTTTTAAAAVESDQPLKQNQTNIVTSSTPLAAKMITSYKANLTVDPNKCLNMARVEKKKTR